MITKTITFLNDYGNGFEATVGVNETTGRVELDMAYVAGGEMTDELFGVCMDSRAAAALADFLSGAAFKAQDVEMTNG